MAKPITVSITGNAGPLKKAVGDAENSLDRLSGAFKKVAAVTAVGVGAIAAGIGFAVKAAAEDQKAFELLSQTLKNNTSATTEQIAAIDKQIGAMSIQVGIADDQLRPAFANLARATGDVTLSQELLTLATNISSATGKDLETVSIALAKGYAGQMGALQKLGVPLDENIIKTKDFDGAVLALSATFAGSADVAANTFAGKVIRLKIAFGETVEQVGSFLIPIFTELADVFLTKVVPIVSDLADRVGPFLTDALTKTGNFIREVLVPAFTAYLLPIIEKVSKFFTENLIPAFQAFSAFITDTLVPILVTIFTPIFDGLGRIFEIVTTKVNENRETFIKLSKFFNELFILIKEKIAPVVGVILKVAFEILAKAIGPAIDIVFKFIDAFASIGTFLVKVANSVLGTIEAMVNGIISGVNLAISVLNKLPGIDIGSAGSISIALPTITAPTAPTATSGGFNPINADRIASPAFIGTSPGLTLPELPASSGGSSGGGSKVGGLTPAEKAAINAGNSGAPVSSSFAYGNAERISDMLAARENAAPTVNITVNTVTADSELPNLIVESLQRYNLISGPLDIQIAV